MKTDVVAGKQEWVCALDIPSNISHLPFAAQLLFFSCSLPFVSRSNSSHFPCMGRGGKLVEEGLGKVRNHLFTLQLNYRAGVHVLFVG